MSTLGTLAVSIVGDARGLEKNFDAIGKNMDKLGKRIGHAGKQMTKFVTGPIIALGVGLGKAAMDLEATEAKYNTVFAGMTDTVDGFIKDFQKLTPATTAEARSMYSGIQDLLVPMGFMREEATELTGEFMHVVGALTNFNSGTHTAEQVSQAMASAITGQTRSLKLLGINVDQSDIQQRVLAMGLAKTTDEITDQMMATALLELVYENSTDALDAYTEANLDAKTKMGLAKAEIIDMAAQMGQHLLPAITTIIDFVRSLTERFANLTEGQQKTILVVLGIVAAIGPLLMIIGKVIAIIGVILPALKVLGAAFVILTGPVGLVIAAIAALIAIGVLLYKNWDTIRDFAVRIWNNAKDRILGAARAIYDGVRGWFNNLRDTVSGVIRGMVNSVIGLFNSMISRLNRLAIKIPDWVPVWGGRKFSPNIPRIPTLHTGTDYFMPPGGRREGLALLQRGEQVIPSGQARRSESNININFSGLPPDVSEDRLARLLAKILHRPDIMEELDVVNYKNMRLSAGRA